MTESRTSSVGPAAIVTPERALVALLVLVVGVSGYVALRFAHQPLLEAHAFRQTQTAITSYWFLRDGFSLAYETPIAGAPWAIPFEAPIYQVLVAGASALTGAPLAATGRVVSWFLLIASGPFAFAVGRRLKVDRSIILVFLSLWFSSPLYVFWGRTFMIETAAVFFALASLPSSIDVIRGDTTPSVIATTALGLSLASLQKVTTAAPLLLVLGACWLFEERHRLRSGAPGAVRRAAAAVVAFGVPVAATASWTRHADAVKRLNAFGSQLTSDALRIWEFGFVEQRYSPELARVVWNRLIRENMGGALGLCLVVSALAYRADARTRRVSFLCIAVVLGNLLIFSNLHIVHEYYQASCGLFLAAVLALGVGEWLPRITGAPFVAPAAALLFVALNLFHLKSDYSALLGARFPLLENRTLTLAEALKRYTSRETAFVAFGYDWSSELAFYAERKSFTVPDWFNEHDRAWQTPQAYLGRARLGAVVVCPSRAGPSHDQVLRRFETERRWSLLQIQGCELLIASKP